MLPGNLTYCNCDFSAFEKNFWRNVSSKFFAHIVESFTNYEALSMAHFQFMWLVIIKGIRYCGKKIICNLLLSGPNFKILP